MSRYLAIYNGAADEATKAEIDSLLEIAPVKNSLPSEDQ